MALACPAGFDADHLDLAVRATYERVARDPHGDFHFHRGPGYAARLLGYDRRLLRLLPRAATASFAGVGNPHRIGRPAPGETVLDIGCGAGMDLLLSARRVAPAGRAIGVDPTPAMRESARASAAAAGLAAVVEVVEGRFEALPLPDASVDVVQSNGVLNLTPDKRAAFHEIARVLRPGGRLHLADVALDLDLAESERRQADLWAACVGGAVLEAELPELAAAAGLVEGRVTERFASYRGTAADRKVAAVVGVHGVNFSARKRA
jgi:SAM-dependent methyltransferase